MNNDVAISVQNISKSFKLPHERMSGVKQAVINIFNTNRGFEKQEVLKDISFEIKKGEFFGIVGRNGSGKSTLLKILAGIYTPNSGTVHVNGSLTPFIELGVGFNPELTGKENVFLNGALLGFSRKQMVEMYEEIVQFAELEKFMDQKLKNYSSGMQVRLAFSIAIRAKSDILLLDEVLAVGDAAFQKKCFEYFMLIKKQRKTVVLVTHDMTAVRQYCDSGIMIDKGQIVKDGAVEQVAQAYQRLFNEEIVSNDRPPVEDSSRWGTGKLKSISCKAKVIGDHVEIVSEFKSLTNLPPAVFGFTVYNSRGVNIVEGNTLRNMVATPAIKSGDSIRASWRIPNIFATDTYSISVACCDSKVAEFYDWHNEVEKFIISKDGNTASIVDPKIEVQISNTVNK